MKMTNRSTKRALLTSIMAMVLCVAMLAGTTFAWFTDSVTSSNNIIKSGTLEVTMEWLDGKSDPNAADAVWKDASSGAIFNSQLWEPGYTEVRHIKIANVGTLALKYQLNIIANGKVSDLADVIDVYYIDPAESITDRAKLNDNNKLGTLSAVLANLNSDESTAKGNLAAGENVTVTLALKMQETAGNDYQNKSIGSSFSIQLLATQYTAEDDSFNNQYDKDAIFSTVVVESEAELVEALAEAKDGDIIGIKGNVAWTTGAAHGSTPFTNKDGTLANVTLQGIDENATFTAIGSGVGPIGIDNGTVIFKDLKIVDNSVSYAEGSWELGYLEFRGNTVFENCEIVNAIMMSGDSAVFNNCSFNSNKEGEYAVWVDNGSATFENCYFNGSRGVKTHEDYGSEVVSVEINNSTFDSLSVKPGVTIGDLNADTSVSITNNTFINCQPGDQGKYIYESDTDVTTFKFVEKDNKNLVGKISSGRVEWSALAKRYQIAADFSALGVETLAVNILDQNGNLMSTITPEGYTIPANGTIGDPADNSQYSWKTVCAAVTGDSGSWQNTVIVPTAEVVPTTMVLVVNGLELAETGIKQWVEWSEVAEKADVTVIKTAAELADFLKSDDNYAGKMVALGADIDLKDTAVTTKESFSGIFDGQGYTISNMTITGAGEAAMFAKIAGGAIVRNVNFDHANVSGTHNVAVICGWEGSESYQNTITNCHVINSTVTVDTDAASDNGDKGGAIIGYAVSATVTNCSVKNTTIKGYRDIGGIIGYANATDYCKTIVSNNTVENVTLIIDNDVNYKGYTTNAAHDVNAVVGEANSAAVVENNTEKNVVVANLTIGTADELVAFAKSVNEGGNRYAGQVVALTSDIDLNNVAWTPIGQTGATQFMGTFDGQNYTISNLTVTGNYGDSINPAAGLFGWLNSATIKNVKVDGAVIEADHNVGVIAGYMETTGCTIYNCHVTNAKLTAKHVNDDVCGDKVGVIVGHAGNAGVIVKDCTAKNSTVTAARDAGQIVGAALTANVINCSATDDVTVAQVEGNTCTGANINNAVIGRVLG